MSTNSIIARATGEGKFAGRYHHWDGNPNDGVGTTLVDLYRGHFKRDLEKMLKVLLDEHTSWSTIVKKDFRLKPGYTSDNVKRLPGMDSDDKKVREAAYRAYYSLPDMARPQCHCHGSRKDEGFIATETSDCGASWAYVFETVPAHDDEPEKKILHILYPEKTTGGKFQGEYAWKEAGRIDLDSDDKIDWEHIECGDELERCHHYAWVHFPQLRDKSNLGTAKFLGREPMEMRDAIAVIVNGKRYKMGGSGGDADFLNRHRTERFPSGTWVQTVIAGNGKRSEMAIARRLPNNEYEPYPGVQWVFPPTLVNPNETVR